MSKNGILRTLRLERRFSKEELCEIFNKEYNLKINKNMISRWESGQLDLTGIYLSAYVRYFNISSGYISKMIESDSSEEKENISEESTREINIVKRLREEQGLSQEQLAELTGYKGKSSPSESLSIVFTLSPIKINFIQTPSKTNISSGVNKKSLPSLI